MAGTDPVADLKTLHRALIARRRQIAAQAAHTNDEWANVHEDEDRASKGHSLGEAIRVTQAAIEAVLIAIADEERIANEAFHEVNPGPEYGYKPQRGIA